MRRTNLKLFWTIGDKQTTNKWEALQLARQTNQEIKFSFFDEAFSKFDWENEPVDSFDNLMKARALQLRDTYDYLRFFYSGGVDSHTALMTFLDNGIHLDEILVYRSSVFTDNFDLDPAEAEITGVAIPFLKSIKSLIPKTRITLLETKPQQLTSYLTEKYFYEESSFAIRPWCERHLYELHPSLRAPLDRGLYHCDIRGGDKPKLMFDKGKVFMAMWDSSRIWDIGDHFLENFYLSPDMPALHAKQCHMVKNYLLSKNLSEEQLKDYFNVFNTTLTDELNAVCRKPRYREINLGKGTTGILSSKQVLVEKKAREFNPRVFDLWNSFLKNEGQVDQGRFNKEDILHDFKGILSNRYLMGKIE